MSFYSWKILLEKKKEKEEWNMRIAGAKTMNKLQENQATYPEYISMIEI